MVTETGQQHISGKAYGVWVAHGWYRMLVCRLHLYVFCSEKHTPVLGVC